MSFIIFLCFVIIYISFFYGSPRLFFLIFFFIQYRDLNRLDINPFTFSDLFMIRFLLLQYKKKKIILFWENLINLILIEL
jgi:hypothetical protein